MPSLEWARGFLAGIFDAEGSHSSGTIRISNTDPEILEQISRCLSRFGFRHCLETNRRNGVKVVRQLGGLVERLRFFHTADPGITRKRTIDGLALKCTAPLRVVEIKPLGFEMPMYDITTGTGDFIADGVVSHNCFARPTHGYLDLDPGKDFETKIVVKTNAVELARAETAPHRWRGDHIAMGTNTDPYQAAEGKYKLTRGIIEMLAERGNPFSILTKSPLVLRDLDVLVEAAACADVKVDFSIGTLDESVWRATEPGTPHPRKRVEAVAKLTAAGIRSGVLVAPILPGLSDDPEQVRQVVSACVEAGASYVTPILLHLRPGVRELYMEWLEKERPDLIPAHEAMYRRAYPPQADRDRLTATVADLVRQAGGIERWRPRPTRPKAWRPEQLRLL
ncbi:MAG TPA: LAGLIDADG family homing endonuclease [Acidimicrobiia bacterium]|nr:LAGLIDADG family homing endonuclease [Acidimicrobiia bacterium]